MIPLTWEGVKGLLNLPTLSIPHRLRLPKVREASTLRPRRLPTRIKGATHTPLYSFLDA